MATIKTQVRMLDSIHDELKQYVDKHGMSMNEAINVLINDGVTQDRTSQDNITPEILRELIDEHMSNLSIPELKQILNLAVRLDTLRNL